MSTRPVTFRGPTLEQILPPGAREAVLRKIALMAIGIIKRRTKAGLDVDGAPFKAYSTTYAEQRRKAGWNASPADLWLTGAMLNSMQFLEAGPQKVLIGFAGSSASMEWKRQERTRTHRKTGATLTHTFSPRMGKAYGTRVKVGGVWVTNKSAQVQTVANASKAYWNDKGDGPPKRHFFGLSKAEQAELTKYAYREMIKLAGQASLKRALGR